MKNLLFKELRLFAAPYAYLFLLAAAISAVIFGVLKLIFPIAA